MDTSISRIDEFRAPPLYPKLDAVEEKPGQGMTPEHLDRLDAIATRLKRRTIPMAEFGTTYGLLSLEEKLYVVLAANRPEILKAYQLTIPEAIDRLGWVDASAMVARWRNRRE